MEFCLSDKIPDGLFVPVSWRNSRWIITRAEITCKDEVGVSTALSTENPPQIHSTRQVPM